MLVRRPLIVAAALLTAAGCSAASVEVAAVPTDVDTAADSPTAITGESDADGPDDSTTTITNGSITDGSITDESDASGSDAEATGDATTTAERATTTTTDTVAPVRLPERDIAEITAMDTPLEPVGTSSGDATHAAQWRLLELGFWVESANGRYDNTTQQAVMAFQKYYGLEPDGVLGPITAEALSKVDEKPQGTSTTGTLVEVDKSKQLVFIIRDGVAEWILNASTGTEIPYDEINKNTGLPERGDSVTRVGIFNVNRQREEGWWAGDLGEIYRPKYFDGGIALHGSNYIPAYPASHGCVRLSTDAMDWIWENDLVPMGTTVWVHGEIPD